MVLELLLVNDREYVTTSIAALAESMGLIPLCFALPSEALRHVEENGPCHAYLVDMNIPREPDGPEMLYVRVKQLGHPVENFLYMTAHMSDHDRGVLERTGREVFIKGGDIEGLLLRFLQMSEHE